jgi:TonB family protein
VNVPSALLTHVRESQRSYPSRISRSLAIACGALVVAFVAALVLIPHPPHEDLIVVEPPPVTARLIEAEPLPEPPAPLDAAKAALEQLTVNEIADAPVAETPPEPVTELLPPGHREVRPAVAPDAGRVGRARAVEATAQLNRATAALDGALGRLSASLKTTTEGGEPVAHRRGRNVRSGRSDGEVEAVAVGYGGSGALADLKGSIVEGSKVAIGALAPSASETGSRAAADARRSGSAPGTYRTNASLLAVIQRYAAGIQYCYGTELKRDPSLRGKLVVALTVAASGEVTEASLVQNSVGSARLADCALAQIREWRFPAIPEGVTTFQTPFVFTPPN